MTEFFLGEQAATENGEGISYLLPCFLFDVLTFRKA